MTKNEQTRKRMNEILAERDILFQEMKLLRDNCSHDNYRIGNWSWRPGNIEVVKICNHCDENLGHPSDEEIEIFTDPENPLNIYE